MTNALLTAGRAVLAAQPFSVHLGAELESLTEGDAVIRVPIRPEFLQQGGYAHAGLIAYAADNAIAFAAGSVFASSVVTEAMTIRYTLPAVGDGLIARASLIGRGERDAECRCTVSVVKDGHEQPCATATGTIVKPHVAG